MAQDEPEEDDWDFFSRGPPDSLRDAGYKNTAYALGELVDNSVEADATNVDIMMLESLQTSNKQRRWKIDEIAILDNGHGMDPFQLRCGLKYQDGAAQRGWARSKTGGKKMGKFGVGLPQATLSQCRRVDIWSWENGGPETAVWTWFDLDDWRGKIPEPTQNPIPNHWKQSSGIWDDSGTLIVWSNLDRLKWKTSQGMHRNAEFQIGKMYRKHIKNGVIDIKMIAIENKSPYNVRHTDRDKDGVIDDDEYHDWWIRANDPLYLDPDAFSRDPPENPAFEQAGESQEWTYEVTDPKTGEKSSQVVTFTASMAKKLTRAGHGFNPKTSLQALGGAQPHGKHMRRNMGLSIVREDRELELDDGWSQGKNVAWERWWGAELCFSKEMDHIFDVTNNKQHAQRLADVRSKDWDYYREDDTETEKEIKDRLKIEDYGTWVCLDIRDRINKTLSIIRDQLQASSLVKKATRNKRHKLAEEIASQKIKERREKGHTGKSQRTTIEDIEKRREALRKQLKDEGLDEALAEHLEDLLITSEYGIAFAEKPIDGDAFFSVEAKVGSLVVFLNENHPAFKHLFAVIDKIDTDEEISKEDMRKKVIHASAALKLVMASWAMYEDEAIGDDHRNLVKARRTWGRYADEFLPTDNDEYEEG